MTVVSDMTPFHYLILIGCVDILPRLYERVFTAPAVMREMADPSTPQAVLQWASSPPCWLHVQEPAQIEDISRLGHGLRGAGEKAAIALARELHADVVLMDDKKAIQEAERRGLRPVRMLTVLDAAAERVILDYSCGKIHSLQAFHDSGPRGHR
jgi:predicted nucleic acid-binding protein